MKNSETLNLNRGLNTDTWGQFIQNTYLKFYFIAFISENTHYFQLYKSRKQMFIIISNELNNSNIINNKLITIAGMLNFLFIYSVLKIINRKYALICLKFCIANDTY